jgi:transcriptional regulator GlxA family with amidase domain
MQVAILLFDRFTALDAVGPYEVLSRLPGASAVFVGEKPGEVRTDVGTLGLTVDATLAEVTRPDIVLVPGGIGQQQHMLDGPIHEWLRAVDATTTWTTAVCTGSLILAAAGLLRGRQATSHWVRRPDLADHGATPVSDRVVFDGKYVTGAGVSAGIDMALHLAARLTDESTARRVQRAIDYDPQPPWGGIDYARIPPWSRALRGAIGLAAPAIAARSRRLTRAGR